MTSPVLDDRSREVLRQLIDLHIVTGEPVGSERLARALNRAVSSATLRNIMADLEELGFLNHPHTSAGRLPTDGGYRLYVDSLMEARPLPADHEAAIRSELHDVSPRQVLERASHVLSKLSGQVGFVLAPDTAATSFRHLDLVRLSHPRVLVVMVSQSGIVTNRVVEIEERLTQDELQACANYLNAHFAGLSLEAIRARLLDLMKQERALYDSLLKSVVAVGEHAFRPDQESGDLYLDGTSNMLDPKVFEDLERLKALFKTFEEKNRLVRILNACMAGEGLRVVIGRENPNPELHGTSLVTASCPPIDGERGFGLGILGSTRMEYASAVTLVDHVAKAVTQLLREMRA
jgi:heat-inducible transcriptional repressor